MALPSTLSPDQQLLRATGITGSEIAALAGCSRYKHPVDVYADKVGEGPDAPDDTESNRHIERGVFLEQGMLQWYAFRTGRRVETPGTIIHPQHPLVIATPDGISYGDGPPRVVECKCPDWPAAKHWGEQGTGQIPSYHQPQIQWELAVTGLQQADVIALLDGDLAIYHVQFDPHLFRALFIVARFFWDKHVVPRLPPPPEASQCYGEYIRRQFPIATTPELLDAPPEAFEHVRQLYLAEHHIKAWDVKRDEAKHNLMAMLEDHGGMRGDWGKIYYRNNKPTQKTNWRAVAQAMDAPPDLIAQHTTQPDAGPRVFRAYFMESDSLLHAIPSPAAPTALPTAAPGHTDSIPAADCLEQPAAVSGSEPQAPTESSPVKHKPIRRTNRKRSHGSSDAKGQPGPAMHAG